MFTGLGSTLVGSAFNLAGGLLGSSGAKKANAQNAAYQLAMWKANYDAQKEFAQNGIRWKVEDSKNAGIHPLFGLGASGSSFSPINTGSYYENENAGLAQSIGAMGQDISRAVQAKETPAEREIRKLKENELYSLDVQQKEANIALTMAQKNAISANLQQEQPTIPQVNGSNGQLIEGQAQSGQYGVLKDVLDSSQWYRTPNGGYMIAPHQQLMDLISEGMLTRGQFYNMLTTAFREGKLHPPRQAKKGYEWNINTATGVLEEVPISSSRSGPFSLFRKNRPPVLYSHYYKY